jgi:exonuclease VII small subunit
MALAKQLTTTLDQAEKRIEKLVEAEAAEDMAEPPAESPARPVGEGELPF